MSKTINFITGNPNKLREFNQIIGQVPNFEFQTKKLIDLPEYQGEPEGICKTKHTSQHLTKAVFNCRDRHRQVQDRDRASQRASPHRRREPVL
jgi:hypothetical protein